MATSNNRTHGPNQGAVEETQADIENTVGAHTVQMPRVQNSIGLYANITGIKWNYETEGQITAGWLIPPEGGMAMDGAGAAGGAKGGGRRRCGRGSGRRGVPVRCRRHG